VTHLRCGGKYDTKLVVNLLPIESNSERMFKKWPTFLKVMDEYQVAHFLWSTVYNFSNHYPSLL